ncbi:hypothetical protein ACX93W_18135 [Paenibacillus sp. CAU 1782]
MRVFFLIVLLSVAGLSCYNSSEVEEAGAGLWLEESKSMATLVEVHSLNELLLSVEFLLHNDSNESTGSMFTEVRIHDSELAHWLHAEPSSGGLVDVFSMDAGSSRGGGHTLMMNPDKLPSLDKLKESVVDNKGIEIVLIAADSEEVLASSWVGKVAQMKENPSN